MASLLCMSVLFATLTFAFPFSHVARGSKWKPLRFTNGTFHISVFEDLHFGENAWDSWGPQQDINSVKVLNEVLDAEDQQLVVLNGDLITGENTYEFNSTAYVKQIVAPIVQRGLPWASTYGNHDSDYNISREGILAEEKRYPNALTKQMVFGENAGVSNYYLPVYPSHGGKTPCLILWFFDSRGGFLYQQTNATGSKVGQPNWVDTSVVEWFNQTKKQLSQRYNEVVPSLAFVHIPTNISQALQTEAGVDSHHQPGINDDYILAQQAQGWCPDGRNDGTCGYGGQDVPFIEVLSQTEGLIGVFSGHDHGDTWCYKWNQQLPGTSVKGTGTNICFGQHSGYGGYGSWTRGGRQILVNEALLSEHIVDTWIRLETGEKVGAVRLNSTYGQDSYPATENTHSSCPTCNYTIISPMPGT